MALYRYNLDYIDSNDENVFSNELTAMMYSFGDAKEPMQESVDVVYKILRQEMNYLLAEAERVANFRKSKRISHEDVLFLMRKNKGKLKRLIEYLKVMDDMPKFGASSSILFRNPDMENDQNASKKKRADMCIDFLASIEDCGEFTSILQDERIIDVAYKNMLERRNAMTKWMDLNEYTEFTEKILRTSFCAKEELHNFERWLLEGNVIDLELTKLAFEIIRFLARETVSKIVDMALTLKSKRNRKSKSPEHSLTPFNFSKVASECNISELLPSPSSTDKNFDHLYHASNGANESMEHTTKDNPESVTNDSVLSAPTVEWTDEVDNLLSSFPGTSMDFVEENKPKDPKFISNVATEENSDSTSSIYQSTTSEEDTNNGNPMEEMDVLSFSENQYFIVEDAVEDSESHSNMKFSPVDSNAELSKAYLETYVAERSASFPRTMPNEMNRSVIENISDDDEETPSKPDASEPFSTRHSSNDTAANMPVRNVTWEVTQSDTRYSSNDKSENTLRNYYQESWGNGSDCQTAITPEEIVQAVSLYHQHSLSNFFYSREKKPKIKLLCIEEYASFKI